MQGDSRVKVLVKTPLYILLSCLVAVGLSAILGTALYGSPYAFLDISRGYSISVRPLDSSNLFVKVGEEKVINYDVINLTSKKVDLNGISVNCSCVIPPSLPITFGPKERKKIGLTIKPIASQSGKTLTQRAVFITSTSGPSMEVLIVVRVL